MAFLVKGPITIARRWANSPMQKSTGRAIAGKGNKRQAPANADDQSKKENAAMPNKTAA